MNEETTKYLKKKNSDISKSQRKAKHKHIYKPCLFMEHVKYLGAVVYSGGSYCTECGKIGGNVIGDDVIKTDSGLYRSMSSEELLEKYKSCPIFDVDNKFQEYVPLSK